MKIMQKDKEKAVFIAEIDESLANAIRRSVTEIPVLAVDEVEISKNDSVLYDEIIAHRIGLIPFKNEKLRLREECDCKGKGCMKCMIQMKLSFKGPGTVYSKDLKGKAEVVYEKMPIVILKEDQELELVTFARLGKGIEHTKFSPGLVYYRNMAEVEIKNCNACKECVEQCPLGLIKMEKKAEVENIWKCDLCEACVEACKKKGNDSITIKPGKEIVFFIESWGQIEAKEILAEAVDAIKENLKQVEKA